jgi:hypothetical protein
MYCVVTVVNKVISISIEHLLKLGLYALNDLNSTSERRNK